MSIPARIKNIKAFRGIVSRETNNRQGRTSSSTLTVFVFLVWIYPGLNLKQCAGIRLIFRLPVARPVPNARLKCCRKATELVPCTGSAVRRRPRGVASMFRLVMSESEGTREDRSIHRLNAARPFHPSGSAPLQKILIPRRTSFGTAQRFIQTRSKGRFLRTARRSFRRRPRRSSRPRGTSADRAWSEYRRCRSPRIPRRRTPSPP